VYLAALGAAIERIHADRAGVAAIYLEETKEKVTVESILAILGDPEFQFGLTPQKMVMIAHFMHRIGSIKHDPESWQALFFPEIHALPGS